MDGRPPLDAEPAPEARRRGGAEAGSVRARGTLPRGARGRRRAALAAALALTVLAGTGATARGATPGDDPILVGHALKLRLDPAAHRIAADDRVTLDPRLARAPGGAYRFLLHAGLEPRVSSAGWRLERAPDAATPSFIGLDPPGGEEGGGVPLEAWRLVPPRRAAGAGAEVAVELHWEGILHHPIAPQAEEYQRGFSETPGTIQEQGVFLAGATYWLPTFGDALLTGELEVSGLEPPWDVVASGARTRHESDARGLRTTAWSSPDPLEEIHLIAGPWTEYDDRLGSIDLRAFLRTPDPALAARYLEGAKRYLRMYQSILPPFPHPSFSLVENFWETGYGMPGFTLLGPQVIRFPWILTSSYPHEILHDWWGNSVLVDFPRGNWCEGLTAYLADHLFEEQKGEGAAYRRASLKKYADFVRDGKDLPLAAFRARRSAATEAIGYGKGLMLFHMARREAGDARFLAALSRFAAAWKFRRASFDDIAAAFAGVTGKDWSGFFRTWTANAGAPRIEIADARAARDGAGGWSVDLALRQTQDGLPFPITVPVAISVEGRDEAIEATVPMELREARATIPVPGRPLRLDVDPAFDVMRRLDPMELPPALSTLFGEDDPLFVLPAAAPPEESSAWRDLAAAWRGAGTPRTVLDAEIDALPGGSVWVLGWSNRFRDAVVAGLADATVTADDRGATIGGAAHARDGSSVVLVARRDGDPRAAIAWVGAGPVAAIPGLARKLPHYTRYGWLAFRGDEPENTGKGIWPPSGSPLVRNLGDGAVPALRLPQRVALVDLPAVFDAAAMRGTVAKLAAAEMQGRGIGTKGLEAATAWVEERLRAAGLEPAGDDGTLRRTWTAPPEGAPSPAGGSAPAAGRGGDPPGAAGVTLTNLIARLPGTDAALAARPVLVTAHLDHLGHGRTGARAAHEGQVHPGADDNASGVAVLLELARGMAATGPLPRPILFAVTTAEESGLLGSRRLLAGFERDRLPFACLNLDTVGRLRDGKLYALNTDSAREWKPIFFGVQAVTGTAIAIVPEPLDASDQVACLERGVPAVQLFTGPNADYHRPSDTAERIDAEGMAKVAEAAHEVVAYLAGRVEPLNVTLAAGSGGAAAAAPAPAPAAPRRAALGSVPDFAFAGPGVRVQEVLRGSPAEAAGLQAGDVIVALDGAGVADLKAYSAFLRSRSPGDAVRITVRRGDATVDLQATLGER